MSDPKGTIAALRACLSPEPDRPVISQPGAPAVTAAALLEAMTAVKAALGEMAGDQGVRIATLLPDHWTTGACVLAATEVASVLPLNPGLTKVALTRIVEDARVDIVVAHADDPVASRLGRPVVALSALLNGSAAAGMIAATTAHRPELILMTSGSTGTPKRVALPPAALVNRAGVIARALRLGPADRALHALPMFHIGAFVDLLLAPLLAGGAVSLCPHRDARHLWAALQAERPSWIQLVPTMLGDMLRARPEPGPNLDLRFVRSVSSGLSADLQAEAEAVFGCPVIQMYGMTETAGQICSNPLPDAPRKPLSVGQPTEICVEVRAPDGHALASNHVGEVFVKGPSVISAYDRSTDLGQAWLATGDLGWMDTDGYLFLTGRVKEQINRGGEKIAPGVIEKAARAHPRVEDAAAFAVPHPTLGETVGLAVVGADDLTEAGVLSHLSNHLAPFEMPRRVQLRTAFPRLPGGKLDRRALAEAHATERTATDAPVADPDPPASAVTDSVAALWCAVLQTDRKPDPETDFFDDGGDSLAATTFILKLEDLLGRPLSPNLLFAHPRFGALVAALDAPMPLEDVHRAVHFAQVHSAGWQAPQATPDGLIRTLRPPDDRAPFFWCCQVFDEARRTSDWLDIGGFYVMPSLFGMPDRTEDDRAALVEALAAEMQALYPTGPLVLGGFCEGARMMERIARRLLASGRVVRGFLCVDHAFDAPTPYPVLHLTKRRKNGYPNGGLALQRQHPEGFEAFATDAIHDDVIDALSPYRDRILPFLAGQRSLARPDRTVLNTGNRASLYNARITAAPPWQWPDGTPEPVRVTVTNRSGEAWPPSGTSGLALMAMEVSPTGKVVDRYLGTAGWSHSVAPGQTVEVQVPITLCGPSRPMILMIGLVDQVMALDWPYRSGGVALYPRWARITSGAGRTGT